MWPTCGYFNNAVEAKACHLELGHTGHKVGVMDSPSTPCMCSPVISNRKVGPFWLLALKTVMVSHWEVCRVRETMFHLYC